MRGRPIPEDARAAIERGALEIIQNLYRRHADVGGREPCVTVGLVADYLRQGTMPDAFRWAIKQRQISWTRSVLETLRRQGRLAVSLGAGGGRREVRCYEPARLDAEIAAVVGKIV